MAVNVLITGANYNNKGAQSMLFITIDEILKRIPGAEIYFGCGAMDPVLEDVNFKQVCFAREGRYIALAGKGAVINYGIAIAKACIATAKGKKRQSWRFLDVKKYIGKMNLIIDVSGFALGDKWSVRTNENFLNIIRLARQYNIPIFIMPQSFGPFHFSQKASYIKDEIKDLLAYPKIVFAREQEGYRFLTEDFGLTNVRLSYDLVLQNKGVCAKSIYKTVPDMNLPPVKTMHNVAVIPNVKCILHSDEGQIMSRYKGIVDELLDRQREVYLFRHSGEDLPICKKIAAMYTDNPHVHFIEQEFSCFEYDEFVKRFDFIICSRYHGIVHAYRNCVPALALGWAVKYKELTKAVGQEQYMVNFTSDTCKTEDIIKLVDKMIDHFQEEKEIIDEKVKRIQTENCFECLTDWVNSKNE